MCLLSGEVVLFDQDHSSSNGMKESHIRKIIWRSLRVSDVYASFVAVKEMD